MAALHYRNVGTRPRSRAFKTRFGIENITIAFATTRDHNRVRQMREWAAKECAATNEPEWLANLFLFTALPENMGEIEPRQLFLIVLGLASKRKTCCLAFVFGTGK